MQRFHALSVYNRRRYGKRVQKIPLDADFSCPNRDGTISRRGCIFCNPLGSGSGFSDRGMDLGEQWNFWHDLHTKRHRLAAFTAYLQSYSNTYGPIEKLACILDRLDGLPGLHSLSLGTRPDCLDDKKLDLLAEQRKALGLSDIFLELGLQSSNDETLKHINRGHDSAAFARAVEAAASRGLNVVAHVIAGLPSPRGRETLEDLLSTVDFINDLPVNGIKFHNLYVCRGTPLARLHENGEYTPLTQEEYLSHLSEALMRLKPTTVIHRLNGNPTKGELIAPDWAANMRGLHNEVRAYLKKYDVWQGKKNGAETGIPDWFAAED